MIKPQMPVATPYVKQCFAAQRAFWGGRRPASMSIDEMCELTAGRNRTEQQQAEIDEYNRQVNTWNAWVRATRATKAKAMQTRKNAAAVQAVRKAACSKCFATHAGEC